MGWCLFDGRGMILWRKLRVVRRERLDVIWALILWVIDDI